MPAPPARRRPSYPVTSVDNALLLILMLRDRGEVRGREAAAELGIAPSSVHRLMSMLVFRGFAVQDETRAYRPGPSIALKVEPIPDVRRLMDTVRPHLEALRDEVAETAHFEVLDGTEVRFLVTAEAGTPGRAEDRAGFIIPAATSAAGRAILATMSDARIARIFGDAQVLTPREHRELHERLQAVRTRGYSHSIEEVERGIVSVAVPLRVRGDLPPAAVSVAGPPHRRDSILAEATIDAVMRCRDVLERGILEQSTA